MRDSQRDCGMPAQQNENEQSALSPAGLHVDTAHVQFTRGPSTRGSALYLNPPHVAQPHGRCLTMRLERLIPSWVLFNRG